MAPRYVLVPSGAQDAPAVAGASRVRRFRLARVGVSPRSELGYDRHTRLERASDQEGRLQDPPSGFR